AVSRRYIKSSHCGKLNLAGNAWYLMRICDRNSNRCKIILSL
ncbi:phenylacetic acid degradation protein PaaY, partial [Escherichia coli]